MGLSLHISIVPLILMVVSLQVISLPLGCLEEERAALLQLKDSLNYPNGTSLPSWRKGDARCCDWELVWCNSSTGRVTGLYLWRARNGELGDWYMNASLFLPLQELIALDLWDNQIAGWVENKGPTNLSTLYLNNITAYGSSFQKLLQPLGAFPNLKKLDLGNNDLRGRILGDGFLNLKNLELLDLSYNTLNSSNIFQTIETMTSLKTLMLQGCSLNGQLPTSQGFLNLKNLELLDLSYSTLNNSNIFQTIGTMTSLKALMLQGCSLNGQLPTGLCDLNHLQVLDISSNDLSGFLPPCLANLTSLQQLDLSSNYLKIPMSLSPLYNLSKLKYFLGSDNEIYAEEDDHNLSPKFQLEYLDLRGHGQSAGAFPTFLYHQFNLQSLGISNIQIKGEFPSWLIENNTYLQGLFLENCSLSGPFLLPRSSHVNLSILSISMNNFHGQIPVEIGAYFPGLQVLMMSDNGFDGIIPSSLGSMSSLQLLDLSHNGFDGSIPSSLGSDLYSLVSRCKQGPDEEVTSLITSWENQVYSPESSTRSKVTEFARCLNKKWSRQISAAKNAIEDLWKLAFSYQVNHLAAVQPLPSTTRGGSLMKVMVIRP
ncbi:hypothetical protein DKX38_028770 [Salix brachista]|uniref:Uncharacterized protein n=1 Tax=Salix brachista TaxID=2182728 RepID=A0A5N5JA37_9ROSI|nr:hypothetical protein DKX38_028770 [Salix brachista]